jgi:Rrf2 family protein
MIVSTRGRYALRLMLDLATCDPNKYIALKDIAERQGVSAKYLERIIPPLSQNDLVVGVHGRCGGYRLTRKPEEYRVGEILRLTDGDLAPVSCSCCGGTCTREEECMTRAMWVKLDAMIHEYFDGITLADLLKGGPCDQLAIGKNEKID